MSDKSERGPYTGEWFDERNKRRQERYATDEKYREKVNKAARDGYRKAKGKSEPVDPRNNLDMLELGEGFIGKLRSLRGRTEAGKVPTVSKAELAVVFERPAKQITTWVFDGRIPNPIITARDEASERQWIEVYTVPEAKAMVGALGPFLAELIYFRNDNKEAIDAAREAITKVRKDTIVS